MPDMEYRFSEEEFDYRADDNGLGTVSGVIVRYGDVAQLGPTLTEQIERGAFNLSLPWWANRMHQRPSILGATGSNLTLSDDADALRFRLELPSTQLGQGDGIRAGQRLPKGSQHRTGGSEG